MEGKPLTPDLLEPFGTTLSVLVDGYKAKCCMGPMGTFSVRIRFVFEKEHPEYGKEWMTKYFEFLKPGTLGWGFDGKTMQIMVLDEQHPFDQEAAAHGFD